MVAEVALSLVLMTGAGLLIRSYQALDRVDLGFSVDGMLSARVSLPAAEYDDEARRVAFFEELLGRLRRTARFSESPTWASESNIERAAITVDERLAAPASGRSTSSRAASIAPT